MVRIPKFIVGLAILTIVFVVVQQLVLGNRPATVDVQTAYPGISGKIAFLSAPVEGGGADLYTVNADGTNRTRLTTKVSANSPNWSPDGKQIAYFSYQVDPNGEISITNVDGSGTQQIAVSIIPGFKGVLTWSPDGKQFAFEAENGKISSIYTVNLDGTNLIKLTKNGISSFHPAWSPDGKQIAYICDDGAWHVFLMNIDGSNPHRLLDTPVNQYVSWSPDGKQLAVQPSAVWLGNSIIALIDVSTGKIKSITPDNQFSANPSWSPDGKQIVYISSIDGRIELFVMNSDGSNPARITHQPNTDDLNPVWH